MLKEVAVLRRYGSDILKGLDKQIAQVLCRMFRPNAMPSGEEILLIADRFETFRMNQGHLGTTILARSLCKVLAMEPNPIPSTRTRIGGWSSDPTRIESG